MYESLYGLSCDPFRLRPDHRFAYGHDCYARARSHLEYGLLRGEGIVLVTGAPGTGKSTLVEDVLAQQVDRPRQVARMLTTQSDVTEFLRMMAFAFGLSPQAPDRTSTRIAIQSFLQECFEQGNDVLLIIDEAQNLKPDCLEELRLLTNVQG